MNSLLIFWRGISSIYFWIKLKLPVVTGTNFWIAVVEKVASLIENIWNEQVCSIPKSVINTAGLLPEMADWCVVSDRQENTATDFYSMYLPAGTQAVSCQASVDFRPPDL